MNEAPCKRLTDCANRARSIIQKATTANELDDNDLETKALDLIVHLRHLADEEGWDFFAMMDQSYEHYLAERAGDDCDNTCARHKEKP